jgi:hypothetical protein
MNESVLFLLKHRTRGALIDANLLLVYIVGKMDRDRLSQFHHTKQYAPDFEIIEAVVELFPKVYTSPNVLTEVSNLGKKLGVSKFFDTLRDVINILEERYCISKDVAAASSFQKLGLTDAGLWTLAAKLLVVTLDFPLYQTLRGDNIDAVNVNHLRPLGWAGLKPLFQKR